MCGLLRLLFFLFAFCIPRERSGKEFRLLPHIIYVSFAGNYWVEFFESVLFLRLVNLYDYFCWKKKKTLNVLTPRRKVIKYISYFTCNTQHFRAEWKLLVLKIEKRVLVALKINNIHQWHTPRRRNKTLLRQF